MDFLVTCHRWNHRVQVFSSSGAFLYKFGTQGKEDGQFIQPFGVALDDYDNILVTEIGNCRVQIFDKDGKFIHKFGTRGNTDGSFKYPAGYPDITGISESLQVLGWVHKVKLLFLILLCTVSNFSEPIVANKNVMR